MDGGMIALVTFSWKHWEIRFNGDCYIINAAVGHILNVEVVDVGMICSSGFFLEALGDKTEWRLQHTQCYSTGWYEDGPEPGNHPGPQPSNQKQGSQILMEERSAQIAKEEDDEQMRLIEEEERQERMRKRHKANKS